MTVIALGTFDGVHRGHQKVISSAVKYARRMRVPAIVITFDPHPQQLIVPERGLKLLTTLEERQELFYQLGIDKVVVIRFDHQVQRLSYEEFVKKYLVNRLKAKKVFVGFDYAFGRRRTGDVSALRRLGKKYGFSVKVVEPVSVRHHPVKSRIIRELISAGKFKKAVCLLGHPYQITGRVVRGARRGKNLGFPTANLRINSHKLIPAHGVYAGRVGERKCVVNIGARPTFGTDHTVVEVHILNFKQNIRGRTLKVNLIKRLRDEKQFSDVEELKEQIRKDIASVRKKW